jgi:hypothetical protein
MAAELTLTFQEEQGRDACWYQPLKFTITRISLL